MHQRKACRVAHSAEGGPDQLQRPCAYLVSADVLLTVRAEWLTDERFMQVVVRPYAEEACIARSGLL